MIAGVGLVAVVELLPASRLVRDILSSFVGLLFEAYFLVFALVLYIEIRTQDEAFDLEMLAAQIEVEHDRRPK